MVEQPGQSVDNSEPKTKAGAPVAIRLAQPIEFGANIMLLVRGNAGAAIPNLDAHALAALAAADDDAAAAGVAHGVRYQIEDDTLQQNEIAAQPGAAGN